MILLTKNECFIIDTPIYDELTQDGINLNSEEYLNRLNKYIQNERTYKGIKVKTTFSPNGENFNTLFERYLLKSIEKQDL